MRPGVVILKGKKRGNPAAPPLLLEKTEALGLRRT